MLECPKCSQHAAEQVVGYNFFQRLFSFHKQCDQCNRLYVRTYASRSLGIVITAILSLQVVAGLVFFPVLDLLIQSNVALYLVFTFLNVLLLPLYWMIVVTMAPKSSLI